MRYLLSTLFAACLVLGTLGACLVALEITYRAATAHRRGVARVRNGGRL